MAEFVNLNSDLLNKLLSLVKITYPDWQGFSDSRFVKDEVTYKQKAVQKAGELLNQADLVELINQQNYAEFIGRLEKVAQAGKNLLFLSIPKDGDINILYKENLDKGAFCKAFLDLIFGAAPAPARLAAYSDWVESQKLPNKWAFPTYYLYLCHPETEIFVKQLTIQWFLKLTTAYPKLPNKPSGEIYSQLVHLCRQLWDGLKSYHPHDWVDLQGFIWVAYSASQEKRKLGKPFAQIFKDFEEANWAFDLFNTAMKQLGVDSPDDKMIAVTCRNYGNGYRIRLNYGSWLVMGANGGWGALHSIHMTLFSDKIHLDWLSEGKFVQTNEEPVVILYEMKIDDFRQNKSQIMPIFEDTLGFIGKHFQNWTGGVHHAKNIESLALAMLQPDKREEIMSADLTKTESDEYFDEETFSLLQKLHENPTKDFYNLHKNEFKAKLEQPFQKLFRDVAGKVRPEIREAMETEKGNFSRLHKNDFGQGGMYDYYWGALYQKGGKRTEKPQLSLVIKPEWFEIGFFIGWYGKAERALFSKNCKENVQPLLSLLSDVITDLAFIIGDHNDVTILEDGKIVANNKVTWQEWLNSPDKDQYDISLVIPKEYVISMSSDQLLDRVVSTFNRLFPFIILSISNDPLPEIAKYLGQENLPIKNYTYEMFLDETGLAPEELSRWQQALDRKKQVILYGPPGTGKTFLADKLARLMVGAGDGFYQLIQFHPEVSYEDFIQGIRPMSQPDGGLHYPIVPGRFLRFCEEAAKRKGLCVLIIDEINRANLARVFGELMYLLEYRSEKVELASGGNFEIPGNVRIIGTMNTADRSIALVDHALRRRFAMLALYPNFSILRKYHAAKNPEFKTDELVMVLEELNKQIADRHFEIGVSYFLHENIKGQIADIWQMEIEPYLEEYFFDQPDKYKRFCWDKVSIRLIG